MDENLEDANYTDDHLGGLAFLLENMNTKTKIHARHGMNL